MHRLQVLLIGALALIIVLWSNMASATEQCGISLYGSRTAEYGGVLRSTTDYMPGVLHITSLVFIDDCGESPSAVAFVEIRNVHGVTIAIEPQKVVWGTSNNMTTAGVGIEWVPETVGEYEARVFLISNSTSSELLTKAVAAQKIAVTSDRFQ